MAKEVCEDKNCPYHGTLSVRGSMIEGKVVSAKMKKTAVIEISYLIKDKKYERQERRRSRIKAHVPDCVEINADDKVLIAECRKLSKTKSFVVMKKI
ncbi:MAG: 30S ribosomal protein S17 [Candidatus Diapherotrites archaeon]|nr:30S ribosomal protein S17 [Candidatus Diapherotrites archaeon]